MKDSITHARALFPRGLVQPEGSFRFSVDALLLAYFIDLPEDVKILDLGCGCGVVGFAAMLRSPRSCCLGIDKQKKLVKAAEINAHALGFRERYQAWNITASSLCRTQPSGSTAFMTEPSFYRQGLTSVKNTFDVAFANPPYRLQGHGRLPNDPSRLEALFSGPRCLNDFCKAASFALKDKGKFGLIFTPSRMTNLLASLEKNAFGIRRIRPVYGKAEKATLILIEAQKNATSDCQLEHPLYLYTGSLPQKNMRKKLAEDQKATTQLTDDALRFCPLLACNTSRSG